MNDYTIFYSWQTDTPSGCGKGFIREALDAAVKEIQFKVGIEESPRVDSGMEGVAGSSDVGTVMFDKIDESSVFIGDATLVGVIQGEDIIETAPRKRTMNPNVAIEMGLAAGILGWGRVICVMNEYYGRRTEIPFDLKNRRFPIDYCLGPQDSKIPAKKAVVKKDLTEWLKTAIQTVEQNNMRKVERVVKFLDLRCLNIMSIYKDSAYFAVPSQAAHPFVDTDKFNSSAIRLLELNMLRAEVDGRGNYAYHWTYLGKQVLKNTVLKCAQK